MTVVEPLSAVPSRVSIIDAYQDTGPPIYRCQHRSARQYVRSRIANSFGGSVSRASIREAVVSKGFLTWQKRRDTIETVALVNTDEYLP